MPKIMTMRNAIFAATLAASLPTAEAWSQDIDWGKKSLSLDTGMSEEAVMKTLGLACPRFG